MIKEFEYEGIWWLPERPHERLNGRLKYTPWDGAVLQLSGSFLDADQIFQTLEPRIILGVSATGKPITLHKCIQTAYNYSDRGFSTSSFHANLLFVGAHFEKPEDIRFKSLNVHYSYLDEWVGISGFKIQQLPGEGKVTIEYVLPERLRARVRDDLNLFIDFRAKGPSLARPQKEAGVEQMTEIRIETSEHESFEHYCRIAYQLQNFLSLGMMEPTYLLRMEGGTEANKQFVRDTVYYPLVEILYKQLYLPKAPRTLFAHDMLFCFKHICDRFEPIMRVWFKKAELLEPTCNLYFRTLYNPDTYLEHHFLNLIHALESFHRSVYGGHYMPKKDYEKHVLDTLVRAIPGEVTAGLKDSLKHKLKYGYEFSLRKRLQDICDKHGELLTDVITDKDDFVKRVIHTRNYLIHHDELEKGLAASGMEIYHLSRRLKKVIEVCLLSELGFTQAEITDLFSGKRKLQQQSV